MTEAINLSGLTKRYGETVGIESVDLSVEQGEVFGFLGPNGAGKTTTIRILLDLIRPTEGQAKILGLDCQEETIAVHNQVGYLPGELALWPDRTGREIIDHFAKLRGAPTDPDTAFEVAHRLRANLDVPFRDLSSGNKQKIGLAVAFLPRPSVLILDEPTTGLDPLMQRIVHDLVDEVRDEGRTVFFSSHLLYEVERIADRVGIIRDGRMVAVEDVDDLIHQGLRRVEVLFREPPSLDAFEQVEGVEDVRVEGERLSCRVSGPMDPLVKAVAERTVVDFRSEDPELEEVFFKYYGEGGEP